MPKIDFLMDNLPDRVFNKKSESNNYKILSSIAQELDLFVEDVEKVRNAKFVDYATGSDLDNLGNILNLRRFSNENDITYRGRLKARVPSFVGGGTVESIKQVVYNLLGVTPAIIEHYILGQGHDYFDNGVIKGLDIINTSNVRALTGALTFDTNIDNYTKGLSYTINVASDSTSTFDNANIQAGDFITLNQSLTEKLGTITAVNGYALTILCETDTTDGTPSTWSGEFIAREELVIEINSGISYILGDRITPNNTELGLPNDSTIFIKMNKDGSFFHDTTDEVTNTQIVIAKVITTTEVDEVEDKRFILDPYQHFITNISSITIQVPYEFNEDKISFTDTKEIIKSTKAAGIAVIMRAVGLYKDIMSIEEVQPRFDFLVGFSGLGSDSFIGGQ